MSISTNINLDRTIRAALDAGQYIELIRKSAQSVRRVQVVDFTSPSSKTESFSTGKYKVWLQSEVKHTDEVVLLFPNHEREKRQMLATRDWSVGSLGKMNLEINKRLRDSEEYTDAAANTRLAICYGEHVFICKGIRGNVYIFWADMNRSNNGNVSNTIYSNVPLLMCCDGQERVTSIFVLKPQVTEPSDLERMPISRGNPQLMFNVRDNLFVCEKRPTLSERQRAIRTISKRDALSQLQSTSKQTANVVRNPYEQSVDAEELNALDFLSDAALAHLSQGSGPDDGTPRSDLFGGVDNDNNPSGSSTEDEIIEDIVEEKQLK